ncbi:P-loop NTPase fold protein [Actinoplanes sp. NPDC049668]|uniref:KAP family P-loop NTPase fold protein n=1 Tax=unclassified Actinoplanes TaxID=2626549 RepID=UPI0033AC16D8
MADDVRAWWADDPISTTGQERLGRGAFVDRLVTMLGEIGAHPSSTVLALVGPWGSGKTSTMNLVLEKLDQERWGIARLNPWALGSAEAIVNELLGAIRTALPERAKSAREKLKTYAVYATPAIGLIPGAGGAATKAFEMASRNWLDEGTLQTHFDDLAKELVGLERPVLVFVDDVDRLQPDELLALLRAIRVVGRLPNVHYAIAYDQLTLVDLVKSTSIASGREDRALAFLEKIVTLRADQPAIRPGQSAALFNDGLARLLADLGANIGEEERRRLSDEWEMLLSADLVEPRSINRYLAQLRVHLPVVGAYEIDLVDFLVVTHLRAAYPLVYRRVLADRSWLAAPMAFEDDERLRAWQDGTRLADLVTSRDLSEEQCGRLLAAARRLFPSLETAVKATARHLGIGNPDYVDRYFVFARHDLDLSDADLARALHAWADRGGRTFPGPALHRLLTPEPTDPEACANSAAALRRLGSLTDQLSPTDAATILVGVTQYLPLPHGVGVVGGPDAAMIQCLIRLLCTVERLDVPDLMHTLKGRGLQALVDFLRALSAARGAITADWLSELADSSANLGWTMFADHVREGDAAPNLPTSTLFSLVENLIGATAVNQLVRAEVDGGLSIIAIASRLIEVSAVGSPGRPVVVDFDAREMIRRAGLVTVRAALDGSQLLAEPDEDDVSWAGRRQHAAAALLAAVDSDTDERRLPVLPPGAAQPFVNRSSVLRSPAGEVPDLRILVTVLMPANASPESTEPAPGPVGEKREHAILATLESSPMTRWMGSTSKSWPLVAKDWEIADPGDGRRFTHSTAGLTSPAPGEISWWLRTPILAGAVVRTGGLPQPFLVADFEIGIWLAELGDQRLPAERRPDSRPLPAALSLDEMDGLLTAMIATGIESTAALCDRLVTSLEADLPMNLRVEIESPAGIDAVLKLEDLQRVGTAGPRNLSFVHDVEFGPERDGAVQRADGYALALLGEALLQSGYRNHEGVLLALRG